MTPASPDPKPDPNPARTAFEALQTMPFHPTMNHAFSPSPKALSLALSLTLGSLIMLAAPASLAEEARTPSAGTPAKAALTITTASPSQGQLPLRLAANGNITAWQEASVGAESPGLRLQEVRVNVGDVVQRDQVLAVFASDTVAADLAQARASLSEAKAQLADAAANAERARSLKDSGALSTQQISQLTTAELTAQARADMAAAVVQQQELRLRHTQVLAPDSGTISARSATVGAVVGSGTELFRLIRQGRLEWRAEVTSAELTRLKPGTAVQLSLPGGGRADGRVRSIAPTVDPQTRTALVYVDLPASAASAGARPGVFARGEFVLGNSGALTVPQQAVVARDGFNYVFRVGADKRVTQQKVEVGRRVGEQVEILRGLDAQSTVAVNGAGFLNDGDTVRIGVAPAPAASAAK
jgi:HlyD family secretion protein